MQQILLTLDADIPHTPTHTHTHPPASSSCSCPPWQQCSWWSPRQQQSLPPWAQQHSTYETARQERWTFIDSWLLSTPSSPYPLLTLPTSSFPSSSPSSTPFLLPPTPSLPLLPPIPSSLSPPHLWFSTCCTMFLYPELSLLHQQLQLLKVLTNLR